MVHKAIGNRSQWTWHDMKLAHRRGGRHENSSDPFSSQPLPARGEGKIHCTTVDQVSRDDTPGDAAPSPLGSIHTTNFSAILHQLDCSLLVTTYQAGKLVVVRSDGGVINTHFRAFNKPMGMAVGRGLLAIGTAADVWVFCNVPAVAARLDPPGKHDACFRYRS
jgi:hypothetical protein